MIQDFTRYFLGMGKGGGGVPIAKFAILSILASTLSIFFDILLYHCFKWIQQNNNQIVKLYKINLLKIHVRVVLYLHVHVCLCFVLCVYSYQWPEYQHYLAQSSTQLMWCTDWLVGNICRYIFQCHLTLLRFHVNVSYECVWFC